MPPPRAPTSEPSFTRWNPVFSDESRSANSALPGNFLYGERLSGLSLTLPC